MMMLTMGDKIGGFIISLITIGFILFIYTKGGEYEEFKEVCKSNNGVVMDGLDRDWICIDKKFIIEVNG